VVVAPVHRDADCFQCLRRVPLRPEAVAHRREVRLENRLHHQLDRHLHYAVSHRRDPERPLLAVSLRDVPPSDRPRAIAFRAQLGLDLLQEVLNAALLDGVDRFPVDPGRAAVLPHPLPRFVEDVTPPHPVVQRVEAPCPALLGAPVQRPLELSDSITGLAGGRVGRDQRHAPVLTPERPHDQSRAPSLQRVVAAFLGTTSPSDSLSAPRHFGVAL
jgi:hypothetical protein